MQTTSKSTRQHVIQKPNKQQNIKDNIKKYKDKEQVAEEQHGHSSASQ